MPIAIQETSNESRQTATAATVTGEASTLQPKRSPAQLLRRGLLPDMVHWYKPDLLAQVGIRTIISATFGQYADQRLIQAVTDSARFKMGIAVAAAAVRGVGTVEIGNHRESHACVSC